MDIKQYGKEQPARWLSVDPAASKYPGWSPYNYTLNNPLIFIDPHGDTIEVTGSRQASFISLVSQASGILMQQTNEGTLQAVSGPVQSGQISNTLRNLVSNLLGSSNTVTINAIGASDQIYFDADPRAAAAYGSPELGNALDMGDFSAIGNTPELQDALLGHILMERSTSGDFNSAHQLGLQCETAIMGELTGLNVTQRTSPYTDSKQGSLKGPSGGYLYFNDFNYGTHSYYLQSPYNNPFNASIVTGVVRVNK
jgi:hypothetical protein